eukprot:16079-Eustigmatos_ZCMA.PRE.1
MVTSPPMRTATHLHIILMVGCQRLGGRTLDDMQHGLIADLKWLDITGLTVSCVGGAGRYTCRRGLATFLAIVRE